MPIANVVDRRTNHYKISDVYAVAEPSCHDNSIDKQDVKFPFVDNAGQWTCKEYNNMNLQDIFADVSTSPYPMTLFIYDEDVIGNAQSGEENS